MRKTFRSDSFAWEGVDAVAYKDEHADGAGRKWRDTARHIIKGVEGGGSFHVRYFEVGPGGYTSLERHEHIHSVIGIRGRGYAVVGADVHPMQSFDNVYVPPMTPHQFVNDGDEPFGFLCVVDAVRDRPRAVLPAELAALRANPKTAGKIRP